MFYDNYASRCREKGISPSKAAEEIGINKASVSNWKKNGYTPRAEILQRIANYFDISVGTLLGREDESLGEEERQFTRRVDLLTRCNLPFSEISKRTGISVNRLGRYYTRTTWGRTDFLNEFPKLARVLGVSPQYLCCLTDEENDESDTDEKFTNYVMGHSNIRDSFPEFQHLYEQKEPTPVSEDGLDPELVALIKRIPADRIPEVERYLRFQAEPEEKL